ncbi:hypothetical protein ACHAXA_007899 [Cyclostephanos tholiformis]|uniref:Uncharacterized protein n=1 Tax=Cyclostephanos tholiformis TaxID=382380 RepID=A0ABD3SHG3_9STRA
MLFYYGGHGARTEFCTHRYGVDSDGKSIKEPWIKHSEIIDLLETEFKGGTVWCIIDCCHSGGFGRAVIQRYRDAKKLHVNYGCVMTVPPSEIAGMEWTITECFIRAFKGELRCSSGPSKDENHCFYLSLKNGKHPIKEINRTDNTDTPGKNLGSHPTWEQVIEYLADEMVRIKGDRLTTLFQGIEMEDGRLLRRPCLFGDALSSVSSSTTSIPRNETWMDPFRRFRHTVNDGVFVKWVGYPPSNATDDNVATPSFRIGWYPGRIISTTTYSISPSNDNPANEGNTPVASCTTACIELYDVILEARWTVTLPINTSGRNTVLGGLPFGFGFDPLRCVEVITRMARKLAYFDTTLPPGIHVMALWNDKFHSAKIICRSEIIWEEIDFDSSLDMKGPCVPVRWEDDESISFVPTHACIVKFAKNIDRSNSKRKGEVKLAEISSRDSAEIISTPMDAMLTSLACDRKKLHGKSPILSGSKQEENSNNWEAYDAENCEWLPVHLMNQVDFDDLPLKVLAFHMCYNESESFSVVYWDTDSTLSIIPNSCLRRRKTDEGTSSVGETSDDDSSSDEATDESTMRKYIACLQIG